MIDQISHWFAECLGLFFGTFLQEDVAIVTGGLLVVKQQLPLVLVAISLYSGVISGDVLIYGLGSAARKIPWIHKKMINPRVENAKKSLEKNLTATIFLVRFLPSILFPTFVACGLMGVSFYQFFITSLVSGVIWTTILLTIVIKLGEVVFPTYGYWGWAIMISISLLIITYKTLKPRWLRLSNNMVIQTNEFLGSEVVAKTLPGMPTISSQRKKVGVSEKIPQLLFYSPVSIQWLLLSLRYRSFTLPTVANPYIEAGGMWGESKSRLMNQVDEENQKWVSPYTTILLDSNLPPSILLTNALKGMNEKGLVYPIVAKPDIGWQGYGVRVIKNDEMLLDYIRIFPKNTTLILQQLVPYSGEAGVFFMRYPGENIGKVTSITLRYHPYVVGDGKSTVDELINQDERLRFKSKYLLGRDSLHLGLTDELRRSVPANEEIVQLSFIGSLRVGGLYRDGKEYITEKVNERFNSIAGSIPEFHFGRFDIKFRSVEHLKEATDFKIFEINGAGSEAIHIWDTEMPLIRSYKELFKYQKILYKISDSNRKRGFKPMGMKEFYRFTKNYNSLICSYPPSQ